MPRSLQKELLDASDIPFEDIRQNMKELNIINKRLGGHAATIAGIKNILASFNTPVKQLSICEAGCGGGDNLLAIAQWCRKQNITTQLTGIDLKKECITYAKEKTEALSCHWIHADYRQVSFASQQKPEIIFVSLFCHHFSDDELVLMMQWMQQNCRAGFFINDLHRHSVAYFSIKALTQLFSNSYLVKNDAPLSVQRGFKKQDWQCIMRRAGISNYTIEWKWAFRWLVTVHP